MPVAGPVSFIPNGIFSLFLGVIWLWSVSLLCHLSESWTCLSGICSIDFGPDSEYSFLSAALGFLPCSRFLNF